MAFGANMIPFFAIFVSLLEIPGYEGERLNWHGRRLWTKLAGD